VRAPGRGLRGRCAVSPSLPGASGIVRGAPEVACPTCASACHSTPVLVALALQLLKARSLSSSVPTRMMPIQSLPGPSAHGVQEGGSILGRPPPRSALHLLTGPPPHARQAAGQLTARERVELWLHLGRLLAGDGLLPAALLARVEQAGERALVGPARTRGR